MGSIADIDMDTANATRAFIQKVASQYDLAGAILFGSRARKSHRTDSDADVAVLLHGRPGKFVATKLAMAGVSKLVGRNPRNHAAQGSATGLENDDE